MGNVVQGATYAFRVCAENEVGKGPFVYCPPVLCQDALSKISNQSFFKCKFMNEPLIHIDVPGRPEYLRVVEKKDDSLSIKWNTPRFDGGSTINGYLVDRKSQSNDEWIPCNRYGCSANGIS